jgi:trehalose 6-phosphate phosphatase
MATADATRSASRPLDLERAALFLDVDGTLLDIAPTPDGVTTPDGLVASLARLEAALGGALAIVTGRTIADVDRLFRPLTTRAAGVYGIEMRFESNGEIVAATAALPARLWLALNAALLEFPGVFAEDKRFSFAVHYRAAPDAATGLRASLGRLAEAEAGLDLEVAAGGFVYELKPRGFNKGRALARFLLRAPFAGRTPVFVGDDAADESAFAAAADRRGVAYAVGRRRPGVAEVFADPTTVREWLAAVVAGRAAT